MTVILIIVVLLSTFAVFNAFEETLNRIKDYFKKWRYK